METRKAEIQSDIDTGLYQSAYAKPTHTPAPWKVREYKYGKDYTGVIETIDGVYLGEMSCTMGQTKKEDQTPIANAAFIVRAVNAHEELLEVAKEIVAQFPDGATRRRAQEAIAKASA